MKSVQIQVLKRNLSELVEEASRGEHIVVTRHNRPVAALGPPSASVVLHTGEQFGHGDLQPAGVHLAGPAGADTRADRASILSTLADDRDENR